METLIADKEYEISYRNFRGESSQRRIKVEASYKKYGEEYIEAWCYLRNDSRTFRLDRVSSITPLNDITDKNETLICLPETPKEKSLSSYDEGYRAGLKAAEQSAQRSRTETPATRPRPIEKPAGPIARDRNRSKFTGLKILMLGLLGYAAFLYISELNDNWPTKPKPQITLVPERVVKPAPIDMNRWNRNMTQKASSFNSKTGMHSSALTDFYKTADLNYDSILSWEEIGSFQKKIDRAFTYRHNPIALPPDVFLKEKGGDCEDWSLFSCGLLTFWGYTCYVGVVDGDGYSSHAIALFYKKTKPANWRYSYYHYPTQTVKTGLTIPAGFYLPIDYQYTGTFSSATDPESPLRRIYRPESIYNRTM